MKTQTIVIVAGIILGLLIVGGIVHSMSAGLPVEAAAAEIGPIRQFVDERGMTRLPKTYLITMPNAGRIEAIPLHEDAPVTKGQVVARIVPRDLELAVEEATAAVKRLEASIIETGDTTVEDVAKEQTEHFDESMAETVKAAENRMEAGKAKDDYAEQDYQRIYALAKRGTVTQDALEQARVRRVQAKVDYRQDQLVWNATKAMKAATYLMPKMVDLYIKRKTTLTKDVLDKQKYEAEVQLDRVLQDQDRGTMCSPVDGVVLKRSVSNERYLGAGETLLEIGRMEDLEVEADILSLDVGDTKEGDPVEIYGPAIGKTPARGTVYRIYPAGFTKVSSLGVEQQRVKIIIHFDPDDLRRLREEQDLGVGYRVRVKITTAEKPDALVIPRSALFRGPRGQRQVYVVRRGRAIIEDVEVGLENDKEAEITSENLKPGDQVVLAPESKLTDGARVTVKQRKQAEASQPEPARAETPGA